MRETRFAVAMGVALIVAGQACGDDDASPEDNPADTTANTTGGGGTGGGGYGGGTAASGGSGASVGTGGIGSEPVRCGDTACAPPEGTRLASACCADTATSTCGLMFRLGAGTCTAAADPDPRCPSVELTGGWMLPSCCTSDGRCGLDATMFAQPGCTSLEDVAARSDGGALPYELPDPRSCDDSDAGR